MNEPPEILELRIPKFPECWESCGNCAAGEVIVDDVLAFPGDAVARDDPLIVLETGKVALDIPAPRSGRIIEVFVSPGDRIGEGEIYMTLSVSADK